MIPNLPPRAVTSHKGDYGRVLVVGGSRGMTGAVALAGMAALRSGAGLVSLAVPDRCLELAASFDPCLMTIALPEDAEGRLSDAAWPVIGHRMQTFTTVACGPGLGQTDGIAEGVAWLYRTADRPLVIDADGLNGLARHPASLASPAAPRVLTPHLGEFRRLTGQSHLSMEAAQAIAPAWAAEHHVVLVLKGHRTLVTDGTQTDRNQTGNPGMASGGAGDVLTGVVTALLALGELSAWDAARLAVHVHGRAGDLAAQAWGVTALTARQILAKLPAAFLELESGSGGIPAST